MPGIAHATVVLVSAGHAQLILLPKRHQTVVDLDPRTVVLGISLALAVLLAAARAVDQTLGTLGHGADAAGLAEHAVAAEVAGLFPNAKAHGLAEVHGVVRRVGGDAGGVLGHALHAVAAAHGNNAVGLRSHNGLHLTFDAEVHAAVVAHSGRDDLFARRFERLGQFRDLRFAAGLTGSGAAVAADESHGFRARDHRHQFFDGFFLRNNHE